MSAICATRVLESRVKALFKYSAGITANANSLSAVVAFTGNRSLILFAKVCRRIKRFAADRHIKIFRIIAHLTVVRRITPEPGVLSEA